MNMNKITLLLSFTLGTLIYSSALQADNARGQIGIGATATNLFHIYETNDIDIEIHPHLQYRGERFNILGDTMGYNFSNNENLRLEAIGKVENRGYSEGQIKVLEGMADRDPSFDAGGRIALVTGMGLFSVDATTDASDTHKGQTVDLRFGPNIYQQHWKGQREVSLSMLAGAKWESDEVVDYYYGVRDNEVTANRAAYKGKAAITPYIGLDAKLNLSQHFTLDGQVLYQHNPSEITDSPIVDDGQSVAATVGLTYWFN